MNCADLMIRDLPAVKPSDTARDTARRMRDHNLGILPVCDRHGHLLGAVTDRSMTFGIIAGDHPAMTHVREVMSSEHPRCRETDDISIAAAQLASHDQAVLVTDSEGRYRGLIRHSDLAGATAH